MQEKLKHSEMSHQTWTWPDLPKAQETSICRQYQELQMESKEFFFFNCLYEHVRAWKWSSKNCWPPTKLNQREDLPLAAPTVAVLWVRIFVSLLALRNKLHKWQRWLLENKQFFRELKFCLARNRLWRRVFPFICATAVWTASMSALTLNPTFRWREVTDFCVDTILSLRKACAWSAEMLNLYPVG